eukprot:symbB.v1.2.010731.t1/scaffold682.1/size173065/8
MLHRKLELPSGDVLIHCGDFTNDGTLKECRDFCSWVSTLPFPHKLLVCGNHDLPCDKQWYLENWKDWHDEYQSSEEMYDMLHSAGFQVLDGSACTIAGVKFYGSPLQPRLPKPRPPMAFGRRRGKELKEEWAKIPVDVDVLITHTPPANILDISPYNGKSIGCEELSLALRRAAPLVHVFGHVHGSYGRSQSKTLSINCAVARERRGQGDAVNPAVQFLATR